jgi:hypothetical protein
MSKAPDGPSQGALKQVSKVPIQARARQKFQSRIVQRSGMMRSFTRSIASRGPAFLKRRET